MCTPVKKPAVAARSVSRPATQSQSASKDVNSSLIQRALDLVHEGQLTAGVAIKLFGIPRSTFYKKLSMCNQPSEPLSTPDAQADQYYQADSDFQTDFGTDDFGSYGGNIDSFVGTTSSAETGMSVGQYSSYGDYYATWVKSLQRCLLLVSVSADGSDKINCMFVVMTRYDSWKFLLIPHSRPRFAFCPLSILADSAHSVIHDSSVQCCPPGDCI